jgi:nicotinamidase-related amidase
VVDVVPTFLTRVTQRVVPHIVRLLSEADYACVVVAEHTKGRRHARKLTTPARTRSDETLPALVELIDPERSMVVTKDTRSAFGNDDEIAASLRRRRITDVHIAGIETHDCVLATALDAFDQGFATCVIERAAASRRNTDHRHALQVLRRLHLTDQSIPI